MSIDQAEQAINQVIDPSDSGFAFPAAEDVMAAEAAYFVASERDNLRTRFETFNPERLRLLFGEYVMYMAGIEPPKEENTPEWYHNVWAGLFKLSDPKTFAEVMDAKYADALVDQTAAREATPTQPTLHPLAIERTGTKLDRVERKLYARLREDVRTFGFMDHEMVPDDTIVQLLYELPGQDGQVPSVGVGEQVLLKLRAIPNNELTYKVKQYERYSEKDGFTGLVGTKRYAVKDLFEVLAVTSNKPEGSAELDALIQQPVRLGTLTTQTALKIMYGFSRSADEIVGQKNDVTSETFSADLQLKQAYYGNSFDYPLFV